MHLSYLFSVWGGGKHNRSPRVCDTLRWWGISADWSWSTTTTSRSRGTTTTTAIATPQNATLNISAAIIYDRNKTCLTSTARGKAVLNFKVVRKKRDLLGELLLDPIALLSIKPTPAQYKSKKFLLAIWKPLILCSNVTDLSVIVCGHDAINCRCVFRKNLVWWLTKEWGLAWQAGWRLNARVSCRYLTWAAIHPILICKLFFCE